MSTRRNVGDWVWTPAYAGFRSADGPQHAQIKGDGSMRCVLDCPDEECTEWATLWTEDGATLYHVAECEMFDSADTAGASVVL